MIYLVSERFHSAMDMQLGMSKAFEILTRMLQCSHLSASDNLNCYIHSNQMYLHNVSIVLFRGLQPGWCRSLRFFYRSLALCLPGGAGGEMSENEHSGPDSAEVVTPPTWFISARSALNTFCSSSATPPQEQRYGFIEERTCVSSVGQVT